jgi:hypothetical protein
VTDDTFPTYLWARTQTTLDSIAASHRVLEKSEATLCRARAAVARADALLKRIHKLCGRFPIAEYAAPPPRGFQYSQVHRPETW